MGPRKKKPARQRSGSAPTATPRPHARWWIGGTALVLALATGIWLLARDRSGQRENEDPGSAIPFVLQPESKVVATYAGSSSCRECHAQAYKQWSGSHHGLAERPLKPELDRAAFEPARSFHHGTQNTNVLLTGDTCQISSKDLSGHNEPQTVVHVIGEDPLRQFLVAGPRGRLQAMEASYDPHRNDWFDVYGSEDRQPGEWGHWTGRGMTWNAMCAACHNTRLRKNYDESTDSYHTTMAEMSVSCEACHGPMKAHVQWEHSYGGKGKKDLNLKPLSRDQMLDTCGSCHSRRGELTGDFVPGQKFSDHYALTIVDNSDSYYPDGQVHEEDYEFAAFLGSKMQAAGVRCVDCHDPHSGKTLLQGNALCMRCHTGNFPKAPVIDPASHTFHKPESAGSQCINCHMPQTTYMQRHHRHDHGFTIPDPLLTRQFGIPNACNRCHADKDTDWALAAANKWYGAKLDRPTRHRAQTIASARRGEDSARGPLQALLTDRTQPPYWKAVAAGVLGRWAADPSVSSALLQTLRDPEPLVRASSARALSPLAQQDPTAARALQPLLSDSSRAVRLAAADGLRNTLDPQSPIGREYAYFLDVQADQPTGQLQKAFYFAGRGDADRAMSHLQTAVSWDPRSAAMHREVAVTYSALGKPREAMAQLQEACRLDPNNADDQYLLGLAYSEAGQPEQTIPAFERAVQLDPRHARAWYNLGLAHRNLGQLDAAVDALRHAEAVDPSDADYPYARATILLQMGRPDDARSAAQRALQIQPTHSGAHELLRTLPPP